jgi:transcriptional regulator with XRE-family HTH domain
MHHMGRSRESKLRRELGAALKVARLAKGMTVAEVAARVRCDLSTVYGVEAGRIWPSFKSLLRLTGALGVEIDLQLREPPTSIAR